MFFIHRSTIGVTALMLVGASAYPAGISSSAASTHTRHTTGATMSTKTLDVHAGLTTIVINASSGGLLAVKRAADDGAAGVDFVDGAIGGEEPLFTLGLTRLSDLGGPLRVLSTDFRQVSVESRVLCFRLDCMCASAVFARATSIALQNVARISVGFAKFNRSSHIHFPYSDHRATVRG